MNHPRPTWIALAGCACIIAMAQAETPFPERVLDEKAFNPSHFAFADIDNDGDLDLLVASGSGDKLFEGFLHWYENDGEDQPEFTEHNLGTLSTPAASGIDVGDIDGDGLIDLAVTAFGPKAFGFEWFRNNGGTPPTFSQMATKMPPFSNTHVNLVDLDGDGDLDPVLGAGWLENDGAANPGFFYHAINPPPFAMARSLLDVADFDGDGDIDLLASLTLDNGAERAIGWFENDGAAQPSFEAEVILDGIDEFIFDLWAADVDADGHVDIVCRLGSDSFTLLWLKNDGAASPAFEPKIITSPYEGCCEAAIGDLDNDDDIDVLVADTTRIVWYENRESAMEPWAMREIPNELMPRDRANILAVADIDGDGDDDIAAAFSLFSYIISWFEQGASSSRTSPSCACKRTSRATRSWTLLIWRRSSTTGEPNSPTSTATGTLTPTTSRSCWRTGGRANEW